MYVGKVSFSAVWIFSSQVQQWLAGQAPCGKKCSDRNGSNDCLFADESDIYAMSDGTMELVNSLRDWLSVPLRHHCRYLFRYIAKRVF